MAKNTISLPLVAVAAVAALAAKTPRRELIRSVWTAGTPAPQRSDDRRANAHADEGRRDQGRGRSATSPWQIPWSGWKDILLRTYSEMNDDRILAVAGGLVFFVLLALFPTIAALVSLYALFADPTTINQHLSLMAGVLPPDSLKLLSDEVTRIASKSSGTLGITSTIALLFALWSANSGTKAIFDGLNVAYEEKEKRSFIRLNLVSLGFTIGAILFLLLAAAAVLVVPLIFAAIGLQNFMAALLSALRWPILLVLIGLALAFLYRFGPSRRDAKWRWITPGSVAASLLWLVASGAFSFYLGHFANYNATYGSLGALIGLLMWLWITFIVILAGAEFDAEIEHQTARDSTVEPEKPLGRRGAKMADTVGQAQST
jgi:membrane protein